MSAKRRKDQKDPGEFDWFEDVESKELYEEMLARSYDEEMKVRERAEKARKLKALMKGKSLTDETTARPQPVAPIIALPDGAPLPLLTVAQACRQVGVGKTTLYAAMESGQLKWVKIGKARRIPLKSLQDFAKMNLKGGWRMP